jgi:hypothetical protein
MKVSVFFTVIGFMVKTPEGVSAIEASSVNLASFRHPLHRVNPIPNVQVIKATAHRQVVAVFYGIALRVKRLLQFTF